MVTFSRRPTPLRMKKGDIERLKERERERKSCKPPRLTKSALAGQDPSMNSRKTSFQPSLSRARHPGSGDQVAAAAAAMAAMYHPRLLLTYFSKHPAHSTSSFLVFPLLQIQALRSDNIPPDLAQRRLEFLLQLLTAHDLRCLSNLSQQFLQASEETDQRTLIDIRHFAVKSRQ